MPISTKTALDPQDPPPRLDEDFGLSSAQPSAESWEAVITSDLYMMLSAAVATARPQSGNEFPSVLFVSFVVSRNSLESPCGCTRAKPFPDLFPKLFANQGHAMYAERTERRRIIEEP